MMRSIGTAPLVAVPALLLSSAAAVAQEIGSRHQWTVEAQAGLVAASSDLAAWTKGGFGKLRYDNDDEGLNAGRVVASYRGRISPTLHAYAVLDYLEDASKGLDVTEAYLEWRPVPTSDNRHRWKIGAYYPPLSLENRDTAWSSPYTISFAAINTWLGEEVRPFGLEWSMRRPLGGRGSPHEVGFFAAGFYGNDPAGTLLFWRGWSVHDRQSRLNDRLALPQAPIFGSAGTIVDFRDQWLEPFHEIDRDPGFYAGVEWEYAGRVFVQLSRYDNRADPYAFASGQWGWQTSFTQVATQLELPGGIGLIGQWMQGETYWLIGVGPDGVLSPFADLVEDRINSHYLMLTRSIGSAHRLSLRYDVFGMSRDESPPALDADSGDAWTVAYRYDHPAGFDVAIEWLRIDSERDVWANFYDLPDRASERQLRVQVTCRLDWPRSN